MNVILKGGKFDNKGAEAMSLVASCNIYKYLSNANIFFFDVGLPLYYGNDINPRFSER